MCSGLATSKVDVAHHILKPKNQLTNVGAALNTIAKENRGKCILVISHGGVLRLLRAHLGGPDQRFPNLSGSWFEHNESSGWHLGSLLYPLQLIADDLRNNGVVE